MAHMKRGFDTQAYLTKQATHIIERIEQFGDKLYLEFGGKLFDDYHASRVLPGFEADAKLQMLSSVKEKAEIVIAICAKHIEEDKKRGDFGITYAQDVLRLIDAFRSRDLLVSSVVITQYQATKKVSSFINRCKRRNVKVYKHYRIEGYPLAVDTICSSSGFGKNEYIETTKPLVVVTAPGPGSGKMATCLSQLYNEHQRGIRAGYAKYETFPIWNLPLDHPVNIAYEAATADLNDVNMIDHYHLTAYGKPTVNYNRDIEIFPVLKNIFDTIYGKTIYQSPTDMGVNMAGMAIIDDQACRQASQQEIIRRYFDGLMTEEESKLRLIMEKAGLKETDRPCVAKARSMSVKACAIELSDGTMITGKEGRLMGPCAAAILNALKYLAHLEDKHLIEPASLEPIQTLKTQYLGSKNPQLHIQEILVALSSSSKDRQDSALALTKLPLLAGCQAHVCSDLSVQDKKTLAQLGVRITYEPERN